MPPAQHNTHAAFQVVHPLETRERLLHTGSDLRAEVWLAPSLQYLPVRLMIRQDEQTWIDLMLQSAPLQAAP